MINNQCGRADLVKTELELGNDPKVPAAAPQPPEQVRVLRLVDLQRRPIRGDDLVRRDVVTRQAEASGQPSHATAERQTANPGVRDIAGRSRQAERLRRPIEITQQGATLDPRPLAIWIYPNRVHS
jgi:hypothetical protein